jgi:hypothetical protein
MGNNLIQSSFGNFEVVFRNAQGSLEHWWRNNNPPNRWARTVTFGTPGTSYGNPALIQSSFGQANRNFEVVVNIVGGGLEHWWRNNDNTPYQWLRGGTFGIAGTSYGNPALIQSSSGIKGNFEVVVGKGLDGLEHWWRDNDDSSQP